MLSPVAVTRPRSPRFSNDCAPTVETPVSTTAVADPPADERSLVARWLTTLTIIGCAAGICVGVTCSILDTPAVAVKLVSLPGQLWLRALKAIVIPMIFCSMVVSTNSMSATSGSGNAMSRMALTFYLFTTFVAAVEGLVFFNVFTFAYQPIHTVPASLPINGTAVGMIAKSDNIFLDTLINFGFDLVPENMIDVFLKTQLLSVISFAIFFGAMVSRSQEGEIVVKFCSACFDALVGMIRLIVLLTPLGVCSLVAGSVASQKNMFSIMQNLGMLFCVVVLAQFTHVFGFYSTLYAVCTNKNPLRYFAGLSRAWMTAFGTSSSVATLSTTIKCCEDAGIAKETVNFVLPIGCTVNMDGSALERPIVVLWIAYMAGHNVPFAGQIVVALTSALLSIGASPIPSAGVSTLVLMVEAARVPHDPTVDMLVGLCLAIEWLFDSVRTTVNVTGDAVGVAVIDHLLEARRGQLTDCGPQSAAATKANGMSACTPRTASTEQSTYWQVEV